MATVLLYIYLCLFDFLARCHSETIRLDRLGISDKLPESWDCWRRLVALHGRAILCSNSHPSLSFRSQKKAARNPLMALVPAMRAIIWVHHNGSLLLSRSCSVCYDLLQISYSLRRPDCRPGYLQSLDKPQQAQVSAMARFSVSDWRVYRSRQYRHISYAQVIG